MSLDIIYTYSFAYIVLSIPFPILKTLTRLKSASMGGPLNIVKSHPILKPSHPILKPKGRTPPFRSMNLIPLYTFSSSRYFSWFSHSELFVESLLEYLKTIFPSRMKIYSPSVSKGMSMSMICVLKAHHERNWGRKIIFKSKRRRRRVRRE